MALFGKKKKEDDKKAQPTKEAEVRTEEEAKSVKTVLPKHGDAASYGVILHPHITEKGSNLGVLNKYVFKVAHDANKLEIARAIEKLYKVKVTKVNITHLPAKEVQLGLHRGTKSGLKKAIVTLRDGDRIEISA